MKEEIKELTSLEDFKIVYGVFSGPPYNEKYTEEELEEKLRRKISHVHRSVHRSVGLT